MSASPSASPTQPHGYTKTDIVQRLIDRRAFEAVVWGMPAVKTWQLPDIEKMN